MPEPNRDSSANEFLPRDFGSYRLVRRLGMGGMAETFEAIRQGPSGFTQRVCLKLVLPYFQDDQEFVKLFEREAKLAAKLRHRNIVGVIDFGSIDGRYYMALELVDGIDLQGLLAGQQSKRLPHEYVALFGHELALALDHAHNPPRQSGFDGNRMSAIVHRDISPSNVLISRQGEIFLADFGVAKAVSGASNKQSAVKGKIPYMSPEQLRAQHCDGRADLFSLGVVLFEALSGERPYDGGNDPATIMKVLNGDHPSLGGLAPSVPKGLCALIEQLIEPGIDDRPQDAAALIDSLEPFVPSPRAQRELGKMVTAIRPEAEPGDDELLPHATTQPGGERAKERDKRTSGIVGAGEGQKVHEEAEAEEHLAQGRGRASTDRRSRAVMVVGVVLGLAGLAAGGLALWDARRGDDSVEKTVESGVPAAAQDPADVTGEEATAATNAEPEARIAAPDPTAAPAANAAAVKAEAQDEPAAAAKIEAKPPPRAPKTIRPARLTIAVFPWGYVWINGKPQGRAPIKNETLKPGVYKISAGKDTPSVTRTVRLRGGQRELVKFNLGQ